MSNANRIVGLDGLRAISICLVLVSHLSGTSGFSAHAIFDTGTLGVKVFFIISGYLITHLLRQEYAKTQTISLKKFYLRRTFRIFPAFYSYIAVVFVLSSLGAVTLGGNDLLHASTYTMNYHPERAWEVGHLWSLAVEEQFYLLWPVSLVLFGVARGGYIALVVMALAPMVRVGTQLLFPDMGPSIGESFETVADSLATGCALAYFSDRLTAWPLYRRMLNQRLVLLPVLAATLFFYFTRNHIRFSYPIGETLTNIGIAFIVHSAVTCYHGKLFQTLNAPSLVWFGQLSYSLYLWQQLFLNRGSDHWTAAFPNNIVLAFLAALLSFYAIESPCLRWRKRIMTQRSTPT